MLLPRAISLGKDTRDRLHREQSNRPLCCVAYRDAVGHWGQASAEILVLLFPDAAQCVQDVEVHAGKWEGHPYQASFTKRPDLQEPVGLPVAAARARLEQAGFHCLSPAAGEKDPAGRPCLLFRACDEHLLGGRLVRVRLYPDEAGIIRETEVLHEYAWFENEQCMLPGPDDSPLLAVCKGVLFPVRVTTLYAGVVAIYAIALPLIGMGGGGR